MIVVDVRNICLRVWQPVQRVANHFSNLKRA
jgi:hypothetical protein